MKSTMRLIPVMLGSERYSKLVCRGTQIKRIDGLIAWFTRSKTAASRRVIGGNRAQLGVTSHDVGSNRAF